MILCDKSSDCQCLNVTQSSRMSQTSGILISSYIQLLYAIPSVFYFEKEIISCNLVTKHHIDKEFTVSESSLEQACNTFCLNRSQLLNKHILLKFGIVFLNPSLPIQNAYFYISHINRPEQACNTFCLNRSKLLNKHIFYWNLTIVFLNPSLPIQKCIFLNRPKSHK